MAVGPGVDAFTTGDKVLSWIDLRVNSDLYTITSSHVTSYERKHIKRISLCLFFQVGGSLAEFAVVPLSSTVKRPLEVSAVDACCIPVAGLTALQAIKDYVGLKLDGKSDENLLITAASGGVGLYAVQVSHISSSTIHVSSFLWIFPLHTDIPTHKLLFVLHYSASGKSRC